MMSPAEKKRYLLFKTKCGRMGVLDNLVRICQSHRVKLIEAYSNSKLKSTAMARMACMAWLHEHGMSHMEIGKLWNRDHSTSVHAKSKAKMSVANMHDEIRKLEERIVQLKKILAATESNDKLGSYGECIDSEKCAEKRTTYSML